MIEWILSEIGGQWWGEANVLIKSNNEDDKSQQNSYNGSILLGQFHSHIAIE